MKQSYRDEYFELERTNPWFIARRELVLSLMGDIEKSARILDAGCGTGFLVNTLKKMGFSNVFGVESSASFLKSEHAIVGHCEQMPLKDRMFDLIFCLDVLEHVDNDDRMAIELWRVLKPGGKLIVTVPAFNFLWSHHDDINQHRRRYNKFTLATCLRNFQIIKMSCWNFFLFLPILCMKFLKRKNATVSDFVPLPVLLQKIALLLFRFENWLVRRINLPWGVSIVAVVKKGVI